MREWGQQDRKEDEASRRCIINFAAVGNGSLHLPGSLKSAQTVSQNHLPEGWGAGTFSQLPRPPLLECCHWGVDSALLGAWAEQAATASDVAQNDF